VPFVWLVCPMKARSDAIHVGNVGSTPRAIRSKCTPTKYFHAVSNA
jgi:hypothetical protein